jgi:hypothetical protein
MPNARGARRFSAEQQLERVEEIARKQRVVEDLPILLLQIARQIAQLLCVNDDTPASVFALTCNNSASDS